ncbi:carbon-nitrogen hydrolase family protein [Antrihabitans spumae]|uniref:Carbon-nitrogen hydrolase family protein n=1 Tax=Antrihabitans spumae TaxID=3373370 RepID=A0ABW7KS21_9NOCA
MPRTITVAAVQPALQVADVDNNLARLDELIRDAHRKHNPDVIIVPEAASSPNVHHPAMRTVARPERGAPYELLTGLARELGIVVGGGYLAERDGDAYGHYVLAEPDGTVNSHDKDIPTMWEQNFYVGGNDDGVVDSPTLGSVGLACGWEWARYGTAARLGGRVDVVLGGMCWPTTPQNWVGPFGWWGNREHLQQIELARPLPGQVARLVGAPVVHASHVGPVTMYLPGLPKVPYRTTMLGETQITERDGTILARLSERDGEGHIAATIELAAPQPLDEIQDRYWIPDMTASVRATWDVANLHGKVNYRLRKLVGTHISR